MNYISIIVLFNIFVIISTKEFANKLDRYFIACRSTDYECFCRQFQSLRNNVLLGNQQLAIDTYKPYTVRYGDTGTCVRISGVEESELVDISMDSVTKEYTIEIELPVKVQQILNTSAICVNPDKEFGKIPPQIGALKNFSGNASMIVSYPYTLRKQKGQVYMKLEEEDIDASVDIPDYTGVQKNYTELFMLSEWAYDVLKHVEMAKHSLEPFTTQLRKVMDRVPLEKLLLLYPEENYSDLSFSFTDIMDEEENMIEKQAIGQ